MSLFPLTSADLIWDLSPSSHNYQVALIFSLSFCQSFTWCPMSLDPIDNGQIILALQTCTYSPLFRFVLAPLQDAMKDRDYDCKFKAEEFIPSAITAFWGIPRTFAMQWSRTLFSNCWMTLIPRKIVWLIEEWAYSIKYSWKHSTIWSVRLHGVCPSSVCRDLVSQGAWYVLVPIDKCRSDLRFEPF